MKSTKGILLFITLLPLISLVYVASLNLEKTTNLKILIWTFKEQRISNLMLIGGSIGFSLSALNIYISLIDTNFTKSRVSRKVVNQIHSKEKLEEHEIEQNHENEYQYLERDVRDPFPTISVPYRIIKIQDRHLDNKFHKTSNDYKTINNIDKNSPLDEKLEYENFYINKNNNNNESDWFPFDNENW